MRMHLALARFGYANHKLLGAFGLVCRLAAGYVIQCGIQCIGGISKNTWEMFIILHLLEYYTSFQSVPRSTVRIQINKD